MQSSAIVIMPCQHALDYNKNYISSSQKKGRVYEKFSRKKKLYVSSEYKGFNLLFHYKNTSLLSLLWRFSFGQQSSPWSKFMEGDHTVEHDIVWPFAGAGCFSIFRMSIVLSFCYIKKGHCSKQDRRHSSRNSILNC